MKKEYDFSKAKLHKGSLVAPAKANKIQKTFRLDEDVFEWLLAESKRKGIPYQTLMLFKADDEPRRVSLGEGRKN